MPSPKKIILLTTKALANALLLGGLSFVLYTLFPVAQIFAQNISGQNGKKVGKTQIKDTFGDALNLYRKTTFGDLLKIAPPLSVNPVDENASIVIEKINVNSPIVWNVSVTNEKEYLKALDSGVAHAAGSALPSDPKGNVYIFSHSTFNVWEIKKYSASFTELNKLQKDDRISILYNGHRYDYLVKQKEIVPGFNTEPLTKKTDEAILTLQTCDPPGVEENRLIITAKRMAVY
ncbi:MAG: Fimbrial associated sortase [candidate division CPR1 bacterium GW2011_GWA2_42_17]|uniref:Fimbrial associated sortase n=1 Tax=candidate division CPR1 bacterium GW2011_GWA2_42_17 TaxID=1618341 RepID=A0A0G0YZC5_9BACT|nr:MAG: Fimbrial associated sortase [candidate division CPR1 bacterium GW2011_GWA2_42_17]